MEVARDQKKMRETIITQLSKLGNTPFTCQKIEIQIDQIPFIQSSVLNQLRRDAIEKLTALRIGRFKPNDSVFTVNDTQYYESAIDGGANVVNHKAEAFYRRHGVNEIEWGYDMPRYFNEKKGIDVPLMTTKYCLRYELGQCLQHKCNNIVDADFREELFLENNGKRFRLQFDCRRCEMMIKL